MKNPLYKLSAVLVALAVCVFAFSYFFIQDGELALPGEKPVAEKEAATEEESDEKEETTEATEEEPAAAEEEATVASEEEATVAEATNAMASLAEAHDALLAIRGLETEEELVAQGFVDDTAQTDMFGFPEGTLSFLKGIELGQGSDMRTWWLHSIGFGSIRSSAAIGLGDPDEAVRTYHDALEYFTEVYGAPSARTVRITTQEGVETKAAYVDDDIPTLLEEEGFVRILISWEEPLNVDGEDFYYRIIKLETGELEFEIAYSTEPQSPPETPASSSAFPVSTTLSDAHNALLGIRGLEGEEEVAARGLVPDLTREEATARGHQEYEPTYRSELSIGMDPFARDWELQYTDYGGYDYSIVTKLANTDEAVEAYRDALDYFTGLYGAPHSVEGVRNDAELTDAEVRATLAREDYLSSIHIVWTNPLDVEPENFRVMILPNEAGELELVLAYFRELV